MGRHYLTPLFAPASVAVFGASDRPDAVGQIVFRNMLDSGFTGRLYPINPNHGEVQGRKAYASIAEISDTVELIVIATPPATIPDILDHCGQRGVKAAVILTAGFSETGPDGAALERKMLKSARRHGIRILGPNCIGIIRPSLGLNATFIRGGANAGNIAFVSQSGALCAAIVDWASNRDVGFSSLVSLGSSADVNFGEILDFLVSDAETKSILLYIEGIQNARTFMSSLRAAARIKPVILVKVGRHASSSQAALSHTASLVGGDDVFAAAVSRTGVVRVQTITQLFTAAKALSCGFRPVGNRLAIVTNGGGPGVMATDRAADLGLVMASLSATTIDSLNQHLPATWSHANPVDIIGDATVGRYHHAVKACLEDENVDGVLVILTPQAMTKPREIAQAMIELSQKYSKPLLPCWMGDTLVAPARKLFVEAHKPSFRTPEPAVEVFSYLSDYYRNQQLMLQVPPPLTNYLEPDIESARLIIEGAIQEHRKILSEIESKAVLSAFHIPVAQTMIARSPNEALLIAQQLGFPVAMKVNSHDITHKSDAGGVLLNLANAQAVRSAYQHILDNISHNRPNAKVDGIAIEPMILKANERVLMVGVTSDPIFGPIITFGTGGTEVEVIRDCALSLPPLNRFLVRELIKNTRVFSLLGAFRHMPPVDMEALENILLRVSEMVCELPLLTSMDINPLLLDENGALAVDARVEVEYRQPSPDRYAHMAIYPYPTHLISHWQLADGTDITIRPIRPEDAEIEHVFVRTLSNESKYFRFMSSVSELTPAQLARFTQLDYSREMALIAVTHEQGGEVEIGVARFSINPDGDSCEFALVVADSMQGKGLGYKLMSSLMDAARSKGLRLIEGEVLENNHNMLKLMASMGFTIETSGEDRGIKKVSASL